MESSGQLEQVNISKTTCELLKDDPDFILESRGKIAVKGKEKYKNIMSQKTE